MIASRCWTKSNAAAGFRNARYVLSSGLGQSCLLLVKSIGVAWSYLLKRREHQVSGSNSVQQRPLELTRGFPVLDLL